MNNLTPKDEWILGYTTALAVSHPEMSPRERFVAAIQHWRDQERMAVEFKRQHAK